MPADLDVPAGALLDALFENATIGLALWDRELRYRRINAELAAMNGPSVEEHIGRRVSEVLPELAGTLEPTFRQVMETGVPLRDVEVSGETPSAPGVTRHWLASYFPVRDGGEVVGLTGIVAEVTAERRVALVDAELHALVEASPLGVAFLDPDLRYRRVNETLARMNGVPIEQHVGRTPEDVLGEIAAPLMGPLRQVLETQQPLDLEAADPRTGRTYAALYFPVVTAGRPLGVGGVVRDITDRHELEEEQSRLLRDALLARAQSEAAQVRAEDAREEAELQRREAERGRERIAFLGRAGREMARSLDWESTLRAVVRSAVPAVADWCALTMVEPSGDHRVVSIAHADPEREALGWELLQRYPIDPLAETGTPNVIRTGEIEVVEDVQPEMIDALAQDEDHKRLLRSLKLRHSVVAPVRTPAGVIGTLTFVLGDSPRRFESEDVALITSLATRAALHIQNARLYAERTHIARTLQAGLRPRALPEIPGADLAARFRPAGDENEVGGDFYDVFLSGDGVWTAIIGDVSGKGPEAAAVTALARHTLRTASMLHDDPAANLALLDRVMGIDPDIRDFCTVFYARMCPGDDGSLDLRYANGGHLPPLVVRRDGTVESVDGGRGPLVGMMTGGAFTEGTVSLGPGDLLLIYTDGVTEVRVPDLDLGERELRRVLTEHAGRSADEVVEAVQRRAVELHGGAPRDDIALLAVRASF